MKKLFSVLIVCFFATTAFAAETATEPAGAGSESPKAESIKAPTKKKSTKKATKKKSSRKTKDSAGSSTPPETR